MKIAFIGQKGIPAIAGGVEKHVEKLSTRLAAQGHEVTVYVRSHYTPASLEEFEGVKLVHVPSINTKHLDAITHTLAATLHALFSPYDIIHYQSIGPSILSVIPRLFKPKARTVATFHSRDYTHKKWGFFARTFLHIAEYITCTVPERTIVSSETLIDYAKEVYGRTVTFIPSGAEVAFEKDTRALAEFGLRSKRYLLAVHRLVPHKGTHYLIKAFKELEDTNRIPNNFKLVIVGSQANTEEYEAFLRHLAEGRSNILLVGEQTGKVLETLYSHAYLYVQPSEQEGLSLALLEAMGHGLLPVVSDIEAHKEAVANTGAFFPVKDVDGLKKELAYFINRSDEVEALGKAAQERVREHYSWDAIAKKTLEVYQDVLSQNLKEHYVSFRGK
ncbi:MAG: glycosyltransferase family 4 protein [Candidatus Moranbacteria bacterium]|nr:glycosyltransferase family 4 protein [Candidatus Moranbacteria bacterium]